MASVAETMTTQSTNAGQAGAARAQAMFGDMSERTKTALERGTKMYEEMSELTKGNVEAIVASSRAAARGVEGMFQEVADYQRKNFEKVSGAMQSFASVRSPTELFQLQSEFAKSSFDAAVAEASKVSEAVVKYVNDVVEPISTRFAVAADKAKSASAF